MKNSEPIITMIGEIQIASKKRIYTISAITGLLALVFSPFGFNTQIGSTTISVPWALIFPIIVSLSYGWKSGLIAGLSGGALFPFLLWPNNGYANLITFSLFLSLYSILGLVIQKQYIFKKQTYYYQLIIFLIIFSVVLGLSYRYLFNILLFNNPPFWESNTINQIDTELLIFFSIKDIINIIFLVLISDLSLSLPSIRRLVGLDIKYFMKFNHRIIRITVVLCIILWVVFLGISFSLFHNHNILNDENSAITLIVIFLGGIISSRIIIHYTEMQLIASNRLSESEKYLKMQFEKMPNAFILWDKNFRVKKWNPSAEKIFGYTESEIIGKSALETIVPENQNTIVSEVWSKLIKNKAEVITNDNITKDGRVITCEWSNNPITDKNGEVTEVISMVQDITVRNKIEACLQFVALQEWEKENDFFESTTKYIGKTLNFDYVLISIINENSKQVNTLSYYAGGRIIPNVTYNLEGSPCENVFGKNLCIYPNQIQKLFPNDIALTKMNAQSYAGHPLWDSNGKPIGLIACISKQPIVHDELIKPILFILSSRVSSEMVRIKTQKALIESEEKYRLSFITSPDSVNLNSLDGTYIDINEGFTRLTGYSKADVIGKTSLEINIWNNPTDRDLLIKGLKEKGFVDNFEAKFKCKDGSLRTALMSARIININQEPCILSITRDITDRKIAEEKLRASEERFKAVSESAEEWIWETNAEGLYTYSNDIVEKILGYKPEEIVGKMHFYDLFDEELREHYKNIANEAFALKVGFKDFINYNTHKNGSKVILRTSGNPILNNEGKLIGYRGADADITLQKQTEIELKESEEKYRLLFENMTTGFALHEIICDENNKPIDYKYLAANPAFEKLTGIPSSSVIGKSIKELLPNIEPYWIETFGKVALLGESITYENYSSDIGKYFDTWVFAPRRGQFAVVFNDITARKKAEQSIKQLSIAIEQSPVSVVITDTSGRIEYINPKFTEVTGYQLDEVIGKNPRVLKSGQTSKEEYDNLWKTIKSGKEWRGEFCNIKKNKQRFWESAVISPIINDNGEITHYVGVKEDITEKKEYEKKILNSIIEAEERERNRFSRELHDGIGPLLSTIKLYFQWLAESSEKDDKSSIIEKGERNINDAIETIREISNNLSPRTLNSFGVVAALKNFIESINKTQKLQINLISNVSFRFEEKIEIILYRVTTELINNTLKYAKASKVSINLFYNTEKGVVNLNYYDNGMGFNFEETMHAGKGLGLQNIVQRINSANGKLNLSSSLGNGIFVEIELPAEVKI